MQNVTYQGESFKSRFLTAALVLVYSSMRGIVIKAKDQSELKFLSNLLKKLGISSAEMSSEELEDLGLSKLLRSVDRNRKVSKASILKKLRS